MSNEEKFVKAICDELPEQEEVYGTCEECQGNILYDYTNKDDIKVYYCNKCFKEYMQCPNCGEIVEEDDMDYYYNDRVCTWCIQDNGYGE